MWAELLIATIVEGYRLFVEWWQTRPKWLLGPATGDPPVRRDAGSSSDAIEDRNAYVADLIEGLIERHGRRHVGLALGVWLDGETWTFTRGRTRVAHRTQPTAHTIFEIGSVTKVFTALLLADMAAEGLVGLDDPVQRHLPAGVELPVRGRPITLLDLATQTSGLPRFPKGLVRLSVRNRANPHAGYTLAELERAIPRARLKRPPGQKIGYSNFGFALLGHVLALRAGTTYEQLVREHICEPLGLDDTSITIAPGARDRFADGHDRRGRTVPHWDLPALAGAGALRSTVTDLLRFLDVHLREPTTPLGVAARASQKPRAGSGRVRQGLAWTSLPLRRTSLRMLTHNGATGGFRSFIGFVPAADVGVVVLSNSARSVDVIGFRALEALSAVGRVERRAALTEA